MTINSTTRKAGPFNGTGSQSAFPFGFKVFTASEVLVVQTNTIGVESVLALNSHYTVALNADQNANPGGTVNMVSAPLAGYKITVGSEVAATQGQSIPNNGGWYPKVVEDALDKVTIQVQQLAEKIGRSVKFPFSDTHAGSDMPTAQARADKLLSFDSDGNLVAVVPAAQTAAALAVSLASAAGSDAVAGTWYGGAVAKVSQLATSIGASLLGFIQAGTGAVLRSVQDKLRDLVNVKDFGAKGDGLTDDTAAIQAAVNAAAGGALYFPPGRYVLSAPKAAAAITIPVAGIRLIGAGKYATTLKTTTDCVTVAAVDADRIEIEHIGFDGSQGGGDLAWQRGVLMRGIIHLRIANCFFKNLGDNAITIGKTGFGGSDAVANGTRQSKAIHIQDNLIEDSGGTVAILTKFIGTQDTIVTGNIIKSSSNIAISIESEGSDGTEFAERIIVANNVVQGCDSTRGGSLTGTAAAIGVTEYARNVVVANNVIDGVTGGTLATGIDIGSSPNQTDKPAVNISIVGNVVTNVFVNTGHASGITFKTGDVDLQGITVSGNQVSNVEWGILFETAFSTKTLGTVKGATITGNSIMYTRGAGIICSLLGSSGDLAVLAVAITGNSIFSTGDHGISGKFVGSTIVGNLIQAAAGIGIYLASGSSKNTINSNNVTDCQKSGISVNGDRTLLSANTCLNNGLGGAQSYGIELASGAYCVIVNNVCGDTQATPTQDYGIRAPNGTTIRGNDLLGNSAGTVWGGIAVHNTGTYDAGLNRTA